MMITKNNININLLRALFIFLLTTPFSCPSSQRAELIEDLIETPNGHSTSFLPSDEEEGYQPFRYDIIGTEKLLDLSKKISTDMPENEEIICVFGATGVGKSTTVNYLINVPLRKVEKGDTKKNRMRKRRRKKETIEVDPKCNLPKVAKIGDSKMSCTEWPECFEAEGSDLTFCDLPGLFDNRGIEKRIVIAFSIKEMIRKSKHVKALFFILSQQNLTNGRGSILTEILKTIRLLLKEPQGFLGSIYFGFTKKENWELDDFMAELEEYVSSFGEKLKKNNFSLNTDINRQLSSDDIETRMLYFFLDEMLKRHKQNFFLIDPLDDSKRNPILQILKKSLPIPKENINFVGDPELYHNTSTLYVKTLESGIHCLDIEKNYPAMIEEREEQAIQSKKIIEKQKEITDNNEEKEKDEEPMKNINDLLLRVDEIHKKKEVIQKELNAMDTSQEVMIKTDERVVKDFRCFSFMAVVPIYFSVEFPIARVERDIENGKIVEILSEKNRGNEYEATYCVQRNEYNQKKVKLIHKMYTLEKYMYQSQIRNKKTELNQFQNTLDCIFTKLNILQTEAILKHNQKQLKKEGTVIEEIDIKVLEKKEKEFNHTTAIMKKSLENAQKYLRESTDLFDMIVSTWTLVFGKERSAILKEFTEKYAQKRCRRQVTDAIIVGYFRRIFPDQYLLEEVSKLIAYYYWEESKQGGFVTVGEGVSAAKN